MTNKDFITDAQLRLRKSQLKYLVSIEDKVAKKDRVDIYLITAPENYYNYTDLPLFITDNYLDADNVNGMAVFNVTKAILLWLDYSSSPEGEIEFEIRIRCPQGLTPGTKFIPNFQFFAHSNRSGQLIITTYNDDEREDSGPSRKKRQSNVGNDTNIASNITECRPNEIECCLTKFKVNFEEIGWTWITRPREVNINYCSGECPFLFGLGTEHAQLLSIMRARARRNPSAAPEPCCVPNSFIPLTIAYSINGIQRVEVIEDWTASSCVCR